VTSVQSLSPVMAPARQRDVPGVLREIETALSGAGLPVVPLPLSHQEPVLAAARIDAPIDRPRLDDGDRVAAAVSTSGSTGTPKLALLTDRALRASADATAERLGGHGQWLLALPTQHVAGFQVLVRSVLAGTVPVLLEPDRSFDAAGFYEATTRLTAKRRYAALVPTQLRRVLAGGSEAIEALGSYDTVLVGGAALDAQTLEHARAAGATVITTYGMTETCGGCVYDGVPLSRVLVEAGDGEPVLLGGPTVFVGYRSRPDLTETALRYRDGVRWHVTADAGRVGPDGRLTVLGRLDDVIITGGRKVAPAEVEAVLAGHPEVAEVAVIGTPDPEWGERVVAVVVLKPGTITPSVDDLRGFAAAGLPPYALPREVRVVDRIPLLPSGKPDRAALLSRGTAR
jgi:O-succinylbenzoic acid--CoA ligase